MEFLFGEGQYGLRILAAAFLVLASIGVLVWLVHVFRSERTRAASRRARQPRLAVIDAATVDGRRRLVLIRRDNVEHLLMIGGQADIVVESNIVRATAREPALARPPAFAEATQQPAAIQLETAPPYTPPRLQQEPVFQRTEAEPPVPLASRQPAPRAFAPEPQLPGVAAEAVFTPAAEAQRLVEALLLRRHQPRTGLTPSPETQPEADAERKYVGAAGLARGGAKLDREGKMASPRSKR